MREETTRMATVSTRGRATTMAVAVGITCGNRGNPISLLLYPLMKWSMAWRRERFFKVLRINAKNRQQAFVTIEGLDIDVYLDGEMARNRGLNSDLVVLSLSEDRTTGRSKSNFGGEDDKLNKSSTRTDDAEQKLFGVHVLRKTSQSFAPYRKRNGLELTNLAKEKFEASTCTVGKKQVQPRGQVVFIKKAMPSTWSY